MKILLAYDGSRFADAAVVQVLARPWPEGTEVRLVTAVERVFTVGSTHGLEGYASEVTHVRSPFFQPFFSSPIPFKQKQ